MFINERSVTVEWGDCDPAGIVFYPRYFAMFDTSTAALLSAASGMTKSELLQHYGTIGFPMVDTSARFILPNRHGDVIRICSQATALRRSSFDIGHTIFRGEAVSVEAKETRVWAAEHPDDPERIKGVPMPGLLVQQLTHGPQQNPEGAQHET